MFQKVLKKILFFSIIKWYSNIGVSPSGKASDSDSDIPVFESQYPSQIIPKKHKNLQILEIYGIIEGVN